MNHAATSTTTSTTSPATATARRRTGEAVDAALGRRRRRRRPLIVGGAPSSATAVAALCVATVRPAAAAASAGAWAPSLGADGLGPALALALALPLLLFLARLLWFAFRKTPFPSQPPGQSVKTMVVLGSGGHTAEMLVLLDNMDKSFYAPRVYVSAATDALSAGKAAARERRWATEREEGATGAPPPPPERQQQRRQQQQQEPYYRCVTIPRSREVGQPWLSSALTTARACLWAARLVLAERPDLLLANGPGTCVPLAAAAALGRAAGACRTRVAYVESVARVRRLSLSARLLRALRVPDVLLVQWPGLAERYPGGGTECVGRLF